VMILQCGSLVVGGLSFHRCVWSEGCEARAAGAGGGGESSETSAEGRPCRGLGRLGLIELCKRYSCSAGRRPLTASYVIHLKTCMKGREGCGPNEGVAHPPKLMFKLVQINLVVRSHFWWVNAMNVHLVPVWALKLKLLVTIPS
jgi:hypothetical protein